jgi:hypothetical protein
MQSAVAVMLARSPKETVVGVADGRASIPHRAQLFVLNRVKETVTNEIGAMRAVANLTPNITCQDY